MAGQFQVTGKNPSALFTLKVHRGEGMALLAMDWKDAQPPLNFVGFAIEYREPNGSQFYPLKNRLTFDGNAGTTSSAKRPPTYSTRIAPIQKFRWVHFPRNAQLTGPFEYQVTPVFMGSDDALSYGAAQNAEIELGDETYPGVLNVAFTRGFISSQAFVDNFVDVDALLPAHSKDGLDFKPTDPDAEKAYAWMGFEARRVLMKALDDAIADADADVGIVAYDFDLPEIIDRLKKLKGRVRVIIDNSDGHTGDKHAEDRAAQLLTDAGIPVVRQSMGSLQHNKTLYVNAPKVKRVICGSTNMSWRGLYVQSNNAVAIEGQGAVDIVKAAFETYWSHAADFKKSPSSNWVPFNLPGIDASISFSPHSAATSRLKGIADDVRTAQSSVLYSLAFLWQTPGQIRDALQDRTNNNDVFVAGISEKATAIMIASGTTNEKPVRVEPLDDDAPEPFRSEPTGLVDNNAGTRMHHKFIVLDFDKAAARVYLGSYNMSVAADKDNGENLILIRDRRIATSYMVEAMRIVDHYEFRAALKDSRDRQKVLRLQRPPKDGEEPWWRKDWTQPHRIADRLLFSR
ncbi:phospholipase D-like domain-containing protein [Mesorhizobium sp. B2-3-5]|uniref:phospholipase D-like domain-containing protein n=1 Tax=Mesorhizobium sp. B2-3-5 TaxID=2589958 RepID=UPI00112772D6|nr:phospholipase D-like domain-containing protein [Mesorhizobium sp. B2-3-5]TPM13489.1 phospholipase [Mesorhizobium sp. B2-3-5]